MRYVVILTVWSAICRQYSLNDYFVTRHNQRRMPEQLHRHFPEITLHLGKGRDAQTECQTQLFRKKSLKKICRYWHNIQVYCSSPKIPFRCATTKLGWQAHQKNRQNGAFAFFMCIWLSQFTRVVMNTHGTLKSVFTIAKVRCKGVHF